MRILGHRFLPDGGLEVEVGNLSLGGPDIRRTFVVSADAVRGGPQRLIPLVLAALEQARKSFTPE